HGDGTTYIGHTGHDREEQGRRHGDFGVANMVVVLHAVFARDAGDIVGQTVVIEGLIGTHQLREFVRTIRCTRRQDRVRPAEVVETGNMAQAATHGYNVTDGLINGTGHHVIGVNIAVARTDTIGNNDPFHGVQQRAQDRGITGAVIGLAHEGLDDAHALHFVVILTDDPLFAADV